MFIKSSCVRLNIKNKSRIVLTCDVETLVKILIDN